VSKEPRGKIEARLESLARMYEAKRAKKAKEEADVEGTDTDEE